MKVAAGSNITTLHLKLITSTNHSARSPPPYSQREAGRPLFYSRPETAHEIYNPVQTPCFHLSVERQRQRFWLKSGLQLVQNTRDRGRCSPSLPPLSNLPFKRSDSHENPRRPSVPVLYPALTAAALPTNTQCV